jgi:putative GTP pyrophosphokinase
VDKRETEPEKFGYYALNYVCKYSDGRISHTEYKRFADVWCEIQITSILRHAWSEIEHPWYDLKEAFPDDIKRRFARIAALLEIAESEFLSLRKIQANYRQAVELQVEANVPDIPVDVVSLKSFIEQEPLVTEVDQALSLRVGRTLSTDPPGEMLERRAAAAKLAGLNKLQDIRSALLKYRAVVPEFVSRCRAEIWTDVATGTPLDRGVCIYQLSLLLVSLKGASAIREFLVKHGVSMTWNFDRQAAIATEVARRH